VSRLPLPSQLSPSYLPLSLYQRGGHESGQGAGGPPARAEAQCRRCSGTASALAPPLSLPRPDVARRCPSPAAACRLWSHPLPSPSLPMWPPVWVPLTSISI
jgi:hypothetical protein